MSKTLKVILIVIVMRIAELLLGAWLINRQKVAVLGQEDTNNIDPDLPNGELMPVSMREVYLGDLSLSCPDCGEWTNNVVVGLGIHEEDESEDETVSLTSLGMIIYPCGSTFYSECLTDKVARILNAGEESVLTPELFVDLASCEEHGVNYSEE